MLAEGTQQVLHLRPASGAYAVALAVVAILAGAVRLGRSAHRLSGPFTAV
jgi:hypothetical protein